MKSVYIFLVISIISLTQEVFSSDSPPKVYQIAKVAPRPEGAPKYSDVCFRYGWIRKDQFPTVQDAKDAIKAFHATRVDWFYPGSHTINPQAQYVSDEARAFINWCHGQGMKIGGAMNTNTTHLPWKYRKHHLSRYVGEVRNPAFIAEAIKCGLAQIDAGVDALVCDDIFKYDDSRKQLWSDLVISQIKAQRQGFQIAGNHGGSIGTEYIKRYALDFHYSDNNFIPTPGKWWAASKAHRALGSALLLHPNRHISRDTRRRLIAFGYANGAHVITPWDEYIHGKKRLFADPKEFADVYGFVRFLHQKSLLNGYEDAFVGGYDLKETRYGKQPPVSIQGGSGKLSLFGRAIPDQSESDIVIHLIESGTQKNFSLKLNIASFPENMIRSARLFSPKPFNSSMHQNARVSQDYSELSETHNLELQVEGSQAFIGIPPLDPWGVVVLSTKP